MLILDATTKSLQFKLSGTITTNQLPFSASYIDSTGTSTTPGEQDGVSNNTTAVTVVGSPASSTQRLVKSITIQNADTAAATVTIIYNNNSTLRNIIVATLAVGDQLIYEDGNGWLSLDKNGNLKTSSGGGGTPGGSNGQVQYNNSGAFGGLANGQLPATATNDNASAGNIGELVSSVVASGSAISLTNNTSANITSISLTAGDWDVWGNVFLNGSGQNMAISKAWVNTTSATAPDNSLVAEVNNPGGNTVWASPITPQRFSLSSTTTIYLSTLTTFLTNTVTACGGIYARRRR